jgi:hypothetical protein
VLLQLDPKLVKFPDRCVECGATASRTFRLAGRSRDHVVFHVPVCERCLGRKVSKRVGWIVGSVLLAVMLVIGIALGSDAAVRSMPALRPFAGPIGMALVVGAGMFVWFANRAGGRPFHRRFSAVWIDGLATNRVALGVRNAELEAAIAVLSGARGAAATGEEPYRGYVPVPPKAHDGRARVRPAAWIGVVLGLGVIGGGIAEYFALAAAEERGETIRRQWIEIALYRAGGKALVAGMLIAAGVLVTACAIAYWRHTRRVRPRA